MTKKNHAIAYWLIPAEPARAFFAEIIGEFARRFDAPKFEPHLTIFVGPENTRMPGDVVREIAAVDAVLAISGVCYGHEFTKTLFVQFEGSEWVQELADKTWRASEASTRFVVDPHVSLLYANLSESRKRAVVETIRLPFSEVRFASVCAMRCASPTETASDVRAWRLMAAHNSMMR